MAGAKKSGPGKPKPVPSTFWGRSRDAAIPVVIHEDEDGRPYLDPKPGDTTVTKDRFLYLVVVNLTVHRRTAEVEFRIPIDGTGSKAHPIPAVDAGKMRYKRIRIDKDIFAGVPNDVAIIKVPFEIRVDGATIDPDLRIQR